MLTHVFIQSPIHCTIIRSYVTPIFHKSYVIRSNYLCLACKQISVTAQFECSSVLDNIFETILTNLQLQLFHYSISPSFRNSKPLPTCIIKCKIYTIYHLLKNIEQQNNMIMSIEINIIMQIFIVYEVKTKITIMEPK